MKFTATGGTDVANMVLFWPDNLPDDADEVIRDEPEPLIERLHDIGKLVQFPCDSDGEYTLSVFVNEELPEPLRSCCHQPQPMLRLIASGDGYFGGAEYMFKRDTTVLEQYSGMCGMISIPAGTYAATFCRIEIPDQLYEAWLLNQAGPGAKRMWELQTTLVALSIALVLAVFAAWLFVSWYIWYGVIAAAAVSIVAAMAIARTAPYRAAVAARQEFKQAFPDYVLQLESPRAD